jgi:hypothetical protein
MFHGDPLMKRVTEIIDRVVEAGIYNYWVSLIMKMDKLSSRKLLSLTDLMNITASTSTTCNLHSISF